MTRAEHIAQRDMVVRSMMLAPTRCERSEERPRKPRAVVVEPDMVPRRREYRLPIVREARYL